MLCGGIGFFAEAEALAEDHAEDQRRPAGGHVHHRAAREVDRLDAGVGIPDAVHEAVNAPDHVRQREINHEHPQRHEQEDGGELHALGDRADDQAPA